MRTDLHLSDSDLPTLSYNLSKRVGQAAKSIHSMTEYYKLKDVRVETYIHSGEQTDHAMQVTSHMIVRANNDKVKGRGQHDGQTKEEEEIPEAQLRQAERFLRRIMPLMESELNEDLRLYQNFGLESTKPSMKYSRVTHTLYSLAALEAGLDISDISWNASEVLLGASYARFEHSEVCSHKGMLCLWGLHKRGFNPSRPETIQTPNCINCLYFHPKRPSIIVCGSYLGEVLLYDVSRKYYYLLARTPIDDYFHRDMVEKVTWWAYRPPGKAETQYNVLSLGSDGKILLWEAANASLVDGNRGKNMFKHPIKGYLMLRKKEGAIVPVSGLTMNQSKLNRNIFIVGSEGGSVLRATLSPISHHLNSYGKALMYLPSKIKFKQSVNSFFLNLLPKNLRYVKSHVYQVCLYNKMEVVDNLDIVFSSKPKMQNLYPNPITYAYEGLSYPISSISDNNYGLFIVNGCDGYGRIYEYQLRENLYSLEEGYYWGWINGGSRMAGFINQYFIVVDWMTGEELWSTGVGEGIMWKESANTNCFAVVSDRTKIRIIELSEKYLIDDETRKKAVRAKIGTRVN